MNQTTDTQELQLIEHVSTKDRLPVDVAAPDHSPAAMMLTAMGRGASLDDIARMMTMQREWEAHEAKKAYNVAFAEFKAEAVRIVKNKAVDAGPLNGKRYAELHAVVDALTPALSRHGLSASWKLTKDDKDWLEVTCYLRHVKGHEESVSMGGPPDVGGAKNALQARASTKTYLERYTLKAICGVSEGGDDNDGAGGGAVAADWIAALDEATAEDAVMKIKRDGEKALIRAKDVPGYRDFMQAVQKRRATLKETTK